MGKSELELRVVLFAHTDTISLQYFFLFLLLPLCTFMLCFLRCEIRQEGPNIFTVRMIYGLKNIVKGIILYDVKNLPSSDEIDADGVNVGGVGSGQIRAVGRFQFHFLFYPNYCRVTD